MQLAIGNKATGNKATGYKVQIKTPVNLIPRSAEGSDRQSFAPLPIAIGSVLIVLIVPIAFLVLVVKESNPKSSVALSALSVLVVKGSYPQSKILNLELKTLNLEPVTLNTLNL